MLKNGFLKNRDPPYYYSDDGDGPQWQFHTPGKPTLSARPIATVTRSRSADPPKSSPEAKQSSRRADVATKPRGAAFIPFQLSDEMYANILRELAALRGQARAHGKNPRDLAHYWRHHTRQERIGICNNRRDANPAMMPLVQANPTCDIARCLHIVDPIVKE